MTFKELHKLFEKELGIYRLADIARELEVSPQVVSNWKNRDVVPYKYVKKAKSKIKEVNEFENNNESLKASKIIVANTPDFSNEEATHIDIIKSGIRSIIKNWTLILSITVFILILSAVHLFILSNPIFISKGTVLPNQDASSANSVSSIMDQFGLGGVASATNDISSAKLFPDIIRSKTLSLNLLKKRFNTASYGDSVSLLDILVKDRSSVNDDVRRELAFKKLKNRINISQGYNSPLLTISVTAPEAKLAKDIADAILDELISMQKRFKLKKINEKRTFIRDRIAIVDEELKSAEMTLKKFREQNRNISGSPALLLEEDRLKREVQVQLQIYITLKRELELAQIEAVEKNTVLTVLDAPEIPVFRESPKRRRGMTVALIIGLMMGVTIAILYDNMPKINKAIRGLN
tara:strand:- start:7313 stop:8536 length:1224 start_codon:yes stop_codon:yes gene_type:complete